MIGTTNRKIIVVPCIVNSWLYVCGVSSVLSAWLSCRRIISASTPPRMKKTKVRTRYMIPMRLWSVVVTHDVQPVLGCSTECATIWGTGRAVVVAMEVAWVLAAGGGRVVGGVGGVALLLLLERLALHGGGLVGALDVVREVLDERLVGGRRDRADGGDHVGVVAPAELGALAPVDAWLRDLEPGVVRVARDGVELAAELRDPPGVDDVLAADLERDGRVRRHDHLLVGERVVERRLGAVALPDGVRVAPDVLLSVDADVQRLAVRGQALVRVGRREDAVGELEPVAARVVRRADA